MTTPRRRSSVSVAVSRALYFALALALARASSACASEPDRSPVRLDLAALDEGAYAASVHTVVQQRCGSPACHGQLPRGLRVYGAHALRIVPKTEAAAPTTADEIAATYESIVGLEPERMREFLSSPTRTLEDAATLTFLSKPLARERHRGGTSLIAGEPAERCMGSWLAGRLDATACVNATPSVVAR